MNDLEDQLRHYAHAVTSDGLPIPERRRSTDDVLAAHRSGFVIAVAALVAILLVAGVLAGRGSAPITWVAVTQSSGGVTVRLELSGTSPAPDETVTARLTVTNDSDEDLGGGTLGCGAGVTLTTDPARTVDVVEGDTGFAPLADAALSSGSFARSATFPMLTFEQFTSFLDPDGQQALPALLGCDPDDIAVPVGASRTVELKLAVGALGLDPGPGLVTVHLHGAPAAPSVSMPLTIPRAPEGTVTRVAAFEAAIAVPEIRSWIERDGSTWAGPPVEHTRGPDAVSTTSFLVWPVEGGWEIGYGDSTGGAFLARVDSRGTATLVGIR
jgi:hypothetical protein